MKIEQFRHQATTEQLNDRLSKVFGSAIKLEQFTDAQLETARTSVLDKIANLEQNESFDGLSHNEDYHKQKMFLDVIDSAINDRTVEAKLQNDILVQADEIIGDYIDMDKEALKMNKQAVIADIEKRQATAQGDESSALHYAKQKVEQSGATWFMGEVADDTTFYEVKYHTPDGTMFDITQNGWGGATK